MSEGAKITLSPIKVLKKSELIAIDIRRKIMRGQLKEGDSLPSEAELIEQFQISRPTLREALRILEADALISVRRGSRGGPVVQLPGPDLAAHHFGLVLQAQDTTLADVYRARQFIEPPAVHMVVESPEARNAAPPNLREVLDDLKQATDKRDVTLMSRYSTRFHENIVKLTGSKTLLLIMQMLNDVHYKHMSVEYGISLDMSNNRAFKRSTSLAIAANERLITLIEEGDADAATMFWRNHLAGVREYLFRNQETKRIIDVLE